MFSLQGLFVDDGTGHDAASKGKHGAARITLARSDFVPVFCRFTVSRQNAPGNISRGWGQVGPGEPGRPGEPGEPGRAGFRAVRAILALLAVQAIPAVSVQTNTRWTERREWPSNGCSRAPRHHAGPALPDTSRGLETRDAGCRVQPTVA